MLVPRRATFAAILACSCTTAPSSPPAVTAPASAEIQVEIRPELARAHHEHGYEGVFVVRAADGEWIASDAAWLDTAVVPASTFKIFNSLVALETGVAPDPEFVLEWDGTDRGFPSWNRDHTLRSAFEHSAVWYYQEIARRISPEHMAHWVTAAQYGNANIEGGIDRFWLNGELRITPRQQVDFLRRLADGALPFSATTVETLLDVMVWSHDPDRTIRAKTGWASPGEAGEAAPDHHVGWFVGSVQTTRGRHDFATLLVATRDQLETNGSDHFRDARIAITLENLAQLGITPHR